MTQEVVLETNVRGTWLRLAGVGEPEPPGSLSSEPPGQLSSVYLFGWLSDKPGDPGVWTSAFGFDEATDAVRKVTSSIKLVRLTNLAVPYELKIYRPRVGWIAARFRLVDA